jgi:dipeptidase E
MKLLLTSAGLTNKSITNELIKLVGKPAGETIIAFITTASNVEDDKSWLEEDLENIANAGFDRIHMVDIAVVTKEEYLPLLQEADIIWFNGGNTYYLLDQVRKSGLKEELPELLKTRVYVGSSAGSGIACPDLSIVELFPEEEPYRLDDIRALGYVSFSIHPHLNSPYFEKPTEDEVKEFANTLPYTVYASDDETAISVCGEEIKIVTEGKYMVFGGGKD